MAYRVYFSNCPHLGKPSDTALEDAVPFDFLSEADAIAICRNFLKAGLVFPVAFEYPDGTRLSAQQIEDRWRWPAKTAPLAPGKASAVAPHFNGEDPPDTK